MFTANWLWLLAFPLSVLLLILLQLLQARRRDVLAGSLLLWRRIALKSTKTPRKTLIFDRSFWLQVAALLLLSFALTDLLLTKKHTTGRKLIVAIDNAPHARFKDKDGAPLWKRQCTCIEALLSQLQDNDRVLLLSNAPQAMPLSDAFVSASDARKLLTDLQPGLLAGSREALWQFALEQARTLQEQSPIPVAIFSPREADPNWQELPHARWFTIGIEAGQGNVGLTAFGSAAVFSLPDSDVNHATAQAIRQTQLLVRIENAGSPAQGRLMLEQAGQLLAGRTLELPADHMQAEIFELPASSEERDAPLTLRWQSAQPDDLAEDDLLVLWPAKIAAPSYRIHPGQAAPHLQELFKLALQAEQVEDPERSVDLEIHVETLPERNTTLEPERARRARALMLLSPPSGYSGFDLAAQVLEQPTVLLGNDRLLLHGLHDSPEGSGISLAQARRLEPFGEVQILLKDRNEYPIFFRMILRDGTPYYVAGFVPGQGWPLQKKFPDPLLPAIFLRIFKRAYGEQTPYFCSPVKPEQALAGLNWQPSASGSARIGGLLNPALATWRPQSTQHPHLKLNELLPQIEPSHLAFYPWLLVLAILLIAYEWYWGTRKSI